MPTGRRELRGDIVVVFVAEFIIADVSPVRSVIQRIAEARSVFGSVQRTSSKNVRVYAGANDFTSMDRFTGQIKRFFAAVSVRDAAAPDNPANPVIYESREPAHLRRAILGNFVSKYSAFRARDRALSANDEDTAPDSLSAINRGMGPRPPSPTPGMGAGGPGGGGVGGWD